MSEEINEEKKAEENSSGKKLFAKTLKQYLDKGVEASKKGLKTAGSAISEFGDKSVNKIDIVQLKNRLEKKYQELGQAVADQLAEDGISISKDSLVVSEKLSSINELKEKIHEKEEALKKYEK
ncbi:hypothetical protein [uncultured Treponema sp.]|uniref:hypothetical protein n=1 Tax=uncultured Treponema sp. TaxID=162155 RepID=UPI0025CDD099|nr:hypothetical protein [uncultured Treponema sp.]